MMFIFATMKNDLNIVWLRDLRTLDHEPLCRKRKLKDNYVIIYLFEPKSNELP